MANDVIKEINKLKTKNFLEYVYLENEFRNWLKERGYSKVYTEKTVRDVRRFYKEYKKILSKKEIDDLYIPTITSRTLSIYRTAIRRYHDFLEDVFKHKIK